MIEEIAETIESWDCSREEKYDSSVTIDGELIPDQRYATVDGLEYSE